MTVKSVVVRNGLVHDGPLYDKGVDTNFDIDTGEELPDELRIMTKQHFKDECDINTIMAKYQSTGQWSHVNMRPPLYGDYSNVASYQEAVNIVMQAEFAFGELPSKVRDRFSNDPQKYMEFVNDPKNYDEAVELGMIPRKEEVKPTKVEVVNPAPPADAAHPQPKGA